MKADSLKFVLTSALIEWFKDVTMKLEKSWEAFEEESTTEKFSIKSQSCVSAQKLDLQGSTSRNAKSINQSVSSQNKP
ncbi:unnamed protein product, partial [Hymenolepis diminuta]